MRFLSKYLSVIFVLCSGLLFGSHNPVVDAAHKASHRITTANFEGEPFEVCSSTAIGPHALLIAAHCASISTEIKVDGKDAVVVSAIGDGLDHTILLLGGITFLNYVDVVGESDVEQADEVFTFGNPSTFADLYRRGVVAGYETRVKKNLNDELRETLYDFSGYMGDSGAGVFNTKGQLIGIIGFSEGKSSGTTNIHIQFMGGYTLHFLPDVLKQARDFVPRDVDAVLNTPDVTVVAPAEDTK